MLRSAQLLGVRHGVVQRAAAPSLCCSLTAAPFSTMEAFTLRTISDNPGARKKVSTGLDPVKPVYSRHRWLVFVLRRKNGKAGV